MWIGSAASVRKRRGTRGLSGEGVQEAQPRDPEPAVCPSSGVGCPLALEVSEAVGIAML